jgi:3-phenylpropionate/trans-cinnamate dioxygenase ferredoxin reductase subunit
VSPDISDFFDAQHRKAGVKIEYGKTVSEICGANEQVTHVRTSDGRIYPADIVIGCVGVVPNVELARDAGLAVGNGIEVNDELLTSDPSVSAIGDVANCMLRQPERAHRRPARWLTVFIWFKI